MKPLSRPSEYSPTKNAALTSVPRAVRLRRLPPPESSARLRMASPNAERSASVVGAGGRAGDGSPAIGTYPLPGKLPSGQVRPRHLVRGALLRAHPGARAEPGGAPGDERLQASGDAARRRL